MRKHFKIISFILSILLIGALFIGCDNGTTGDQLVQIRLNEVVRSIFYAPMYVAINKGFFEEEGLSIELSTGQGADKTMQQVLSGSADIGFCGPEQVIYLYNQGREDYAVVFAQLTKRDGSFLVGREQEEDFKWENLKGKTVIGGRPGGVPEMSLEYVLKEHGMVPNKDVELITNLAFTATASAFKSGMGDYVALFEPTASMLQEEDAGHIVAYIGKASGEMAYTCFFATKSYIEQNQEIIQKFTNAIYKGQLWIDSHTPKEIAEAVIDFFPGSDIGLLTTVVERYHSEDAWSKTPVSSEAEFTHLQDVIQSYKADLIPERPPFDKIVINQFAEEAVRTIKK